jgi:hypothetical protein
MGGIRYFALNLAESCHLQLVLIQPTRKTFTRRCLAGREQRTFDGLYVDCLWLRLVGAELWRITPPTLFLSTNP